MSPAQEFRAYLDQLNSKIAGLQGMYGPRQAKRGTSKTQLNHNRSRYFPEEPGKFPTGILSLNEYKQVRKNLAQAVTKNGQPCLTAEELVTLDGKYEYYQTRTLTLPAKAPERFRRLLRDQQLRTKDLSDPDCFETFIGQVVYSPIARGQHQLALGNIRLILGALDHDRDVRELSGNDDRIDRALSLFAFCLYRAGHPDAPRMVEMIEHRSHQRPDSLLLAMARLRGRALLCGTDAELMKAATEVGLELRRRKIDHHSVNDDLVMGLEEAALFRRKGTDRYGSQSRMTYQDIHRALMAIAPKNMPGFDLITRIKGLAFHENAHMYEDGLSDAHAIRVAMERGQEQFDAARLRLALAEASLYWGLYKRGLKIAKTMAWDKYLTAQDISAQNGAPLMIGSLLLQYRTLIESMQIDKLLY